MKFLKIIALFLFLMQLPAASFAQEGEEGPEVGAPQTPAVAEGDFVDDSGLGNYGLEPDYFSGAATYRIDIEVPPGRAGMTPKIGLTYDSNRYNKDSIVGLGWDMTETYIARSSSKGTPNYALDNNYVFHLNGNTYQLIASARVNGCDEYRFKIEETDRYMFYKCGNRWEGYDKEGKHYIFGDGVFTQFAWNGGRDVYRWYLSSVADLNGNTIEYQYEDNMNVVRGEELSYIYLKRIRYTNFEISFSYANRPLLYPDYSPGFGIYLPSVLLSILVREIDGRQIKLYNLEHEFTQGIPFLTAVGVTGGEGNESVALPVKRFSYFDLPSNQYWSREIAGFSDPSHAANRVDERHQFLDMNGDGLVDRVVLNEEGGGYSVYMNIAGAGFSNEAVLWRDICNGLCGGPQLRTHIRDMNGDGLPDRVLAGEMTIEGEPYRGFFVRYNDGNSWRWSERWDDPVCDDEDADRSKCGELNLIDMTRDGLPDRLLYDGASQTLRVYTNLGHRFSETAEVWNDPARELVAQFGRDTIDMNGDNLPDRIAYWSDGGEDEIYVYYNNGHGWNDRFDMWSTPVMTLDWSSATLKDVNADGFTDLVIKGADVGAFTIYLNYGGGFNLAEPINIAGAGQCDRLLYGGGMPGLMDMNGDGYEDIVCPINDSMYSVYATNLEKIEDGDWTYSPPYRLKKIDNGRGVKVKLSYAPSVGMTNRLMPFNVFCLNQIKLVEGPEIKITYIDYAGGQFFTDWNNVYGRRFNGFNFVRIRDPLNNVEYRRYHQTLDTAVPGNLFRVPDRTPTAIYDPTIITERLGDQLDDQAREIWRNVSLSGKMYRKEVYIWKEAGHVKYRDTNYIWQIVAPSRLEESSKPAFIYMSDRRVSHYDGAADGKTTRIEYSYDRDSGNALFIKDYGVLDGPLRLHEKRFEAYATFNTPYRQMASSRPGTVSDLSGNETLKNRTIYTYDDKLNVLIKSVLVKDRNGERDIRTFYERDAFGNITRIIDPLNRTTEISYDPLTNTYPARIEIEHRFATETTYDARYGSLLTKRTPDGRLQENSYDGLGRLLSSTFQARWRERYEYIENQPRSQNRFLSVIKKYTNIESDPGSNNRPREVVYKDGQGRAVQISSRSERANRNFRTIARSYTIENDRNVLKENLPLFTVNENYSAFASWRAFKTVSSDGLKRPLQITPQAGDLTSPTGASFVSYGSNDNPWFVEETDAEAKRRQREYDDRGRITRVVEFLDDNELATAYEYDFWDNLVFIRDAHNNITTFTYDNLKRKTDASSPDAGAFTFEYDDVGNLIRQRDAMGQRVEFSYDALNRVTASISYNAAGVEEERITYIYDSTVNEDGVDESGVYDIKVGELFKVTDANGWTKYSYDEWGNVKKMVRKINSIAEPLVTEYEYEGDGLLQRMNYPGSQVVLDHAYDPSGKIKEIVETIAGERIYKRYPDNGYNVAGHLLKEEYGDGTVDEYQYYTNSKRLSVAKNGTYSEKSYSYDRVSNIKSVTGYRRDADNTRVDMTNIVYDDLHRLTAYTEQTGNNALLSVGYQYDEVGNLIRNDESFRGVELRYGQAHRLTGAGGENLAYDNNGNLTAGRHRGYTYDARNRLKVVDMENGRRVEYGYDYQGVRLFKRVYEGNNLITESYYLGKYMEIRDEMYVHNIFAGDRFIAAIGRGWLNGAPPGQAPPPAAGFYRTLNRYPQIPITTLALAVFVFILIAHRQNSFPPLKKGGEGGFNSLAFRLASLFLALILLYSTTASAYIFRADVDDDWPPRTAEFFFYIHTDHLGSSCLYTEGLEKATHAGFRYKKGQLVQRVEYTPFGVERYILNPLLNAEPKYTGQVFDIDTDLYYYGARYYDPVIGRFIQPDSLISDIYNPQTLNPYSYVLNNPLKYVDPTGYAAFDLEWEEGLEDKYGLLDDADEGSAFGMDDGSIAEGTAIGSEREFGFDYEQAEFKVAEDRFRFEGTDRSFDIEEGALTISDIKNKSSYSQFVQFISNNFNEETLLRNALIGAGTGVIIGAIAGGPFGAIGGGVYGFGAAFIGTYHLMEVVKNPAAALWPFYNERTTPTPDRNNNGIADIFE